MQVEVFARSVAVAAVLFSSAVLRKAAVSNLTSLNSVWRSASGLINANKSQTKRRMRKGE